MKIFACTVTGKSSPRGLKTFYDSFKTSLSVIREVTGDGEL